MRRRPFPALLLLVACSGPLSPDAGGPATADASQPFDAGARADGGSPDTGWSDAGGADAGAPLDAGPPDSGLPDAGPDAGSLDDAGTLLQGQLLGGTGPHPGAIAGLRYSAGTQTGVTDALGTFTYQPGTQVTFQVADVTLRPVLGAAHVSPFQLAGDGGCSHSTELEKALVLLYSLDLDGDPATGTQLAATNQPPARALASLSLADLSTLIAQVIPGRVALPPEVATDLFIAQLDDEAWVEVGLDTFSGLSARPAARAWPPTAPASTSAAP